MPREVELKLECSLEEIRRIVALPVLAGAEPAPDQAGRLQATYFDTPDQDLRQAGLSIRLRRKGDRTIQTVKADEGMSDLLLDRNEWETSVEGDGLDLKAVPRTVLAPFLKAEGRIKPAFTVETERAAYRVRRGGTLIELVADEARVGAGRRELCFGEVELELKEGDRQEVFELAIALAEAAPVRLSLATKSERGYALLSKEPPKPVKAERIRISRRATSAEAFRIIARSCLAQAIRNEALIRRTQEPPALHQMRVGLRRLRAAASLFKDLVADEESAAIRQELRWMNHALGPPRDLDVLVERMRETQGADRKRGHGRALAAAERRRREAYAHVLALLDEARFRRAVLATATWIENGSWLAHDDPDLRRARDEPVVERAGGELARRFKKVLKHAKCLGEIDAQARHRVRIEIKKLRYGVEFLGPLFRGGKAKKRRHSLLQTLENLQEVLGELNDIATGNYAFNASFQEEEPLLDRARALVRELRKTKQFWK